MLMADQVGVVLASASAARQNLLRSAGLKFDVLPSNVDEVAVRDDHGRDPLRVVRQRVDELVLEGLERHAPYPQRRIPRRDVPKKDGEVAIEADAATPRRVKTSARAACARGRW